MPLKVPTAFSVPLTTWNPVRVNWPTKLETPGIVPVIGTVRAAGLAAGYRDNGTPGVREHYSSEAAGLYYAAFLLDPDGNNVEAVHRGEYP